MSAGSEQRWIVLDTDGRHVSPGRNEPSDAEVMAASVALAAQGLSGWPACMQDAYYSLGRVMLEPLQRIGADHEADSQTALTAFHTAQWVHRPRPARSALR